MDYCQESGNVVQIITEVPPRTGIDNMGDQAIWATEDEYVNWNNESLTADASSNSNHNGRQSQTRFRSETPNRKPSGDSQANNRSKAIGKMFFKTKMCCKFRAGTCPYVTNCNFAHSVEELRKPPPNWQEIVAAHEDERSEPREEYQILSLGSSGFIVETQRSYKGRHCKKFYTEEGCPYGDSCTYLHDEQSRARESVAICLGPGSGGGYGGGGSNVNDGGETYGGGGGGGTPLAASLNSAIKPSNWKTRICNKWEQTGYCPFGSKCHFAHGATELHQNVGGLGDTDAKDPATVSDPNKQGMMVSKLATDNMVVGSTPIAAQSDGYHVGGQSQRLPGAIMRTGLRSFQKWKGPDKLSRIYGDWIDDIE